ncbi:MAG: NAD-dependent epimerase/dehydratase family protein, partial [Spartobacteria bacterium]
ALGFIGSHLVDALLADGHEVLGIDDLSTGRLKNLDAARTQAGFRFLEKDIRSLSKSDLPFTQCDWFFHLAGRADLVPSIVNPEDYFQVNVDGTFRALQLARELGVKRFLYTASSTCYGIPHIYPTPESTPCKPEHPYALTKLMGEELVMHWHRVYQLPTLSLRLFNVYGPRSRTTGAYGAVFGVFLRQKLAGVPFTVGVDGTQTRDFTFVSDVASAFLAAAKSNAQGEILNVGSGHSYPVNQLVDLLGGEKTFIPRRPGEPDCTFADTSKIRSLIGWSPSVTLEQGVSRMLDVIDDWRDAPLWNEQSIAQATADWFKHLGHTS